MHPRARSTHLVIHELSTETLVFDQRTSKAHCLNRTTALVWKHCDGHTDLAAIGRTVERELDITAGVVVVQLALEQLLSRHLLEGTVDRGTPAQRRSRREVLKQLAAAAVALPVILTVAAPRSNAAGSPSGLTARVCLSEPDGTPCGTGQICCHNVCSSSSTLFLCRGGNSCCKVGLSCTGELCNTNDNCCPGLFCDKTSGRCLD